MKIAVNVQTLIKDKLEGLGWFTYESLKRIVQQHPEHDFLFIFAKGVDKSFLFADNVEGINVGPRFIRPQAWYIKFELLLPAILKKHKIDLFISTDGITSTKLKMKNLDVIHDLNFEENPEWLPKSFAKCYKKNFPKWAKNATRIATVSEYSKQSIHQHYKIPLDKIDVVYNGCNELYQPISIDRQKETKEKYTRGSDYFIFIGGLHPRKNIDKLLLGFDAFKQGDKTNMKLVIVGSKFYWNGPIKDAYDNMKFKEDVIFTGHLPISELVNLLPSAFALTYVSLFEGFGIPLVEAMNCDTAIITSNVTSLPEIAKDAALYVNPLSVNQISEAMHKISSDSNLREALIEKGRVRKRAFSWQQTADKLWESIEKTMN
jgi:glycosyltransferase involved in cell wall biosynthesis